MISNTLVISVVTVIEIGTATTVFWQIPANKNTVCKIYNKYFYRSRFLSMLKQNLLLAKTANNK